MWIKKARLKSHVWNLLVQLTWVMSGHLCIFNLLLRAQDPLISAWRSILPWNCSSKTTQNTAATVSVQTILKKFHLAASQGHESFWSPFLLCCLEAAIPKAWCQWCFSNNSQGHPFLLIHTGNHILNSYSIYKRKQCRHSHPQQWSITTGRTELKADLGPEFPSFFMHCSEDEVKYQTAAVIFKAFKLLTFKVPITLLNFIG